MTEPDEDEKVVRLHLPTEQAGNSDEHPLAQALKRVGPISDAPPPTPPDRHAERQPNRLAIGVMTGMSAVSFVAAYLTPATADNGVKFGAAMAMVWGIISMAAALLYRYGREFWKPRSR